MMMKAKNKVQNSENMQAAKILFLIMLPVFYLVIFSLSMSLSKNGLRGDSLNSRMDVGKETLIVSNQSDPYYGLAQKIAYEENLEVVENLTEALGFNPKYILLVASPENFTEERLLSIGSSYKRMDYYPALGIISGSSLENAEQLWRNGKSVHSGENYFGGDVEKGQLIEEPAIYNIDEGYNGKIELNKDNLSAILLQTEYFYWSRHVSEDKWFWNTESKDYGKDDQYFAEDIPKLNSIVIYTPSCGSFQPWTDDSISLGFVDKGAAAYVGHVRSPISNSFFIRHRLAVPGIYSWDEFPLGIAAQIQNKETANMVYNTPLFFMLGDPRIYLLEDKPYQINSDRVNNIGRRVITGESNERGILAIKIEGGAAYEYLKTSTTSVSDNDPFYNNDLQMLNLGADKYILYFHTGGDFRIELFTDTPIIWKLTDPIVDVFDYSWIAIGVVQSPFSLILLVIFTAVVIYKIIRKKTPIRNYRVLFLAGLLYALVRLIYLLTRIGSYTVSASIVEMTIFEIILGFVGVFSSTASGLVMMRTSKKTIGKVIGMILALLPQLLLTGFYFANITLTNIIMRNNTANLWLWNYKAFWMPLGVLLFEALIMFALYRISIFRQRTAI
jgi:hypothetical protein